MKNFRVGMNSQKGSALIGSLLAVGILGIVVAASSKMMVNLLSANRELEIRGDRESVRRTLLDKVSCDATFDNVPVGSCAGQLFDVKGRRADGTEFILIAKGGTKYGVWTYRAECTAANELIVKAALAKSLNAIKSSNPSDFNPDPLTKNIKTWDDESTLLFSKGTTLCGKGLKQVRMLVGTYQGQCNALAWPLCSKEQEILVGGKPSQVQIYNINNNFALNLLPFNSIKFSTMTANGGWQTVTNFSGAQTLQGPIANLFFSGIKFTDKSFRVRGPMNINFNGPFGFLSAEYHYVVFIEY